MKAEGRELIHLLRLRDSLIDRFASGEPLLHPVPVGNRLFSQFPAQQDRLPVDFAGKIEQANTQVFHLHACRINFRQSVFDSLLGFGTLGFATGERHNVKEHPPVQKHAVLQCLLLGIGFIENLFGTHCRAQQRFEYR